MLASYLSEEYNNAEQVVLNLKVSIHSIYILVTEPAKSEKKDDFLQQKRFMPKGSEKSKDLMDIKNKIRAILKGKEETNQKNTENTVWPNEKDDDHDKPDDEHSSDEFRSIEDSDVNDMSDLNTSSLQDEEEKSRLFADSFRVDLYDLRKPCVNDTYVSKESTSEANRQELERPSVQASSHDKAEWWSQNLILLIEILQIKVGLKKCRNQELKTQEEMPFTVRSFLVSSPQSLNVAWNHKNKSDMLYSRISALNYSFFIEKLIKHKNSEENPLFSYLYQCGGKKYADFLTLCEK